MIVPSMRWRRIVGTGAGQVGGKAGNDSRWFGCVDAAPVLFRFEMPAFAVSMTADARPRRYRQRQTPQRPQWRA